MWKLLRVKGIRAAAMIVIVMLLIDETEGVICTCNSCDDCRKKIGNLSCSEVHLVANIRDSNCIKTDGRDNLIFDCTAARRDIAGKDDFVFYMENSSNFTIRRCDFDNPDHGDMLRDVILIKNSEVVLAEVTVRHEICPGGGIGTEVRAINSRVRIENSRFEQFSCDETVSRSILAINSNMTLINNRIEKSVFGYDLYSENWRNSSGINNMCKKPHSWNDTGTIGCKYWDYGVCKCWNCSDCNFKLNDGFCTRTDLINNISASGDCLNWDTWNTFNGQHFTIRGDGTGVGLRGRISENVTIERFWRGMEMPLSTIRNVRVRNNTNRGIEAATVTIIGVVVEGNGVGGINAARLVLQHSRVCRNGEYDIRVWHSCLGGWANNSCSIQVGHICHDEPMNPLHGVGCYRRCETSDPTTCETNLSAFREYYIRNLVNVSNCFNITRVRERVAICLEGVIDGRDVGYAFYIRNASNITILNCNITQFFNGIEIHESRNITIRNSTLHHIRRYPLLLNRSSGEIVNCTMYEIAWARGYKNISSNFTFRDSVIIVNPWCIDDPTCTAVLIMLLAGGGLAVWYYRRHRSAP